MKEVIIYTDGACSGNPGPGGYGVVLLYEDHRKELSGGFSKTTNNRMELTALIKGLEAIKEKCEVTVYSDSKYVVDGIGKGWALKWRANNWMRNKRDPALNRDLWEKLLELLESHDVEIKWVRGHSENPLNEHCDNLAVRAYNKANLPVDKK
ncbi:ribonuclease HI [bacterium]|nr:ribonuclease HI [bacterium]